MSLSISCRDVTHQKNIQYMYTFSVNDLIENGTKSLIFFLFESPAPHSRDHLKNKNVASGDVKLYHVERSSKLTPKKVMKFGMKREYLNRAVTWAILSASTDTRLIVLHNNCMCVIELNKIYMVICSVL